jgi:hypothetical protein
MSSVLDRSCKMKIFYWLTSYRELEPATEGILVIVASA